MDLADSQDKNISSTSPLSEHQTNLEASVSIAELVNRYITNGEEPNELLLSDETTWAHLKAAEYKKKLKEHIKSVFENAEKLSGSTLNAFPEKEIRRIRGMIELERQKKHAECASGTEYCPLPESAYETRFFREDQILYSRKVVGTKLALMQDNRRPQKPGEITPATLGNYDYEASNILSWGIIRSFSILRDESWDAKLLLSGVKRFSLMAKNRGDVLRCALEGYSEVRSAMVVEHMKQAPTNDGYLMDCSVCRKGRPLNRNFRVASCPGFFCSSCLRQWLEENKQTRRCPDKCWNHEKQIDTTDIEIAMENYVTERDKVQELVQKVDQFLLKSKDEPYDIYGPDFRELSWRLSTDANTLMDLYSEVCKHLYQLCKFATAGCGA